MGHRIETWARQTKHADGITWFLSKLEAEARADPDSELLWSVPIARSDRAYNWGQSAIAPDADRLAIDYVRLYDPLGIKTGRIGCYTRLGQRSGLAFSQTEPKLLARSDASEGQ